MKVKDYLDVPYGDKDLNKRFWLLASRHYYPAYGLGNICFTSDNIEEIKFYYDNFEEIEETEKDHAFELCDTNGFKLTDINGEFIIT